MHGRRLLNTGACSKHRTADVHPANRSTALRRSGRRCGGPDAAVYDHLDLGAFEQVEPAIRDFSRKKRRYRTNRCDLPPEVAERVHRRWTPYFERYGCRGPEVESASA